ncbi:MAG: outer membrane beta-barrel protein [Ginsengibacter sp.]
MKKLLTLAVLAGVFSTASSQTYIQGGVNLANITKSSAGETQDNNMLTTFNAGLMHRFNIAPVFDIETGIKLDGRGSKADTYFTSSREDNFVKTKFNPLYLEIPLNAVVKIPIQDMSSVFFHVGPYASMGVAGKSKSTSKFLGVTSSSTENIKFNNDDPTTPNQEGAAYDRIKRFDFGLNFGGGLDLGAVLVKLNYGMGFNKISSMETNNSDHKNKYRTLSLSLGIPLSR